MKNKLKLLPWFCAGLIVGVYANSDIGAKYGLIAGEFTRRLLGW